MRFKSRKCVRMRLRPGLRLGPRWGAYSAPQTHSWIWGSRERRGRKGREGRGGKGKGGCQTSEQKFRLRPWLRGSLFQKKLGPHFRSFGQLLGSENHTILKNAYQLLYLTSFVFNHNFRMLWENGKAQRTEASSVTDNHVTYFRFALQFPAVSHFFVFLLFLRRQVLYQNSYRAR